jgi:single-strand DNA-binding protein
VIDVRTETSVQTRKYTDTTGAERYSTEIVADNIRFLGSKSDSAGSFDRPKNSFNNGKTSGSMAGDEEIPF